MAKIIQLLLICSGVAIATEEILHPIDEFSYQSFLKLFREEILSQIAGKWNITIQQAEVLRKQMDICHGKIEAVVGQCQNCTSRICQTQPSFRDYTDQQDPLAALKAPLAEVGESLDKVVDLLGTASFGFLEAVGGIGTEAGMQLGKELQSVVNSIGNELQKLPDLFASGGQDLLDGLKNIGDSAAGGLTDLGNTIGGGLTDAGNAIANGISSLFGRRRHYYSAIDQDCMARCDGDCAKLMTTNNTVMIHNVCGPLVITLNSSIHRSIDKLMHLYNATLDTNDPIISKIEVDQSSLDPGTMTFTTMYVTGQVRGTITRYRSSVTYKIMDLPGTAQQVAHEFWSLWN